MSFLTPRGSHFRAALLVALLLIAVPSGAADAPVLIVVPPGSDMARVEAARAAVPASRAVLSVGAAERVPMREGVELVLDRTFSDAPPADLVIVLPGEAAGEEEFLVARRGTAKIILFLGESPLVKLLKGDGSRGALVLIGEPAALRTLSGAGTGAAPAAAAATSPGTPRAPETATPRPAAVQKATPSPAGGAVHQYFSARTPTPTPRS